MSNLLKSRTQIEQPRLLWSRLFNNCWPQRCNNYRINRKQSITYHCQVRQTIRCTMCAICVLFVDTNMICLHFEGPQSRLQQMILLLTNHITRILCPGLVNLAPVYIIWRSVVTHLIQSPWENSVVRWREYSFINK